MSEIESIQKISNFLNQIPWMNAKIYGNSMGEYLSVAILVFITFFLSRAVMWIIEHHARRFTAHTKNKIDDQILELLHRSISYICTLTVIYIGVLYLNFPNFVDDILAKILFVLFTLKIARELEKFAYFLLESYLESTAKRQKSLVKTFLVPMARMSKFIIWTLTALLIAGNLGYNISSLLAGLGVGGLAVALAAQETLSNTFGSFSILSGQPLKVGEWVEVDGVEGEVMEIGLRSTQIRTVDERLVSIPNKITSNVKIQNYSRRKNFNVKLSIKLSYETSLEKIKKLKEEIRKILNDDPDVKNGNFRVNIMNFGEYAMDLGIFYYITDVSSYARSIEIRERVNLQIKELIDRMKIKIPYPTQSLNLYYANSNLPSKGDIKIKR